MECDPSVDRSCIAEFSALHIDHLFEGTRELQMVMMTKF